MEIYAHCEGFVWLIVGMNGLWEANYFRKALWKCRVPCLLGLSIYFNIESLITSSVLGNWSFCLTSDSTCFENQ